MKKTTYLFIGLLLIASTSLWGQQAASAAVADTTQTTLFSGIMTKAFLVIGALLFFVSMFYMIRVNQFLYNRIMKLEAQAKGLPLPQERSAAAVPAGDDFWARIRKKYWEDAVPIEREGEIMSHHAFDGIHELDNRLPPWWVNMFIITIIWAVGYMFYYHWGGDGPSQVQEYENTMQEAKKELAIALAGKANAVDESSVTLLTDSGPLGEGELIFKGSCAACHGQKGEGAVGPNLTDEYWIHGGGIKNVFKTIKYGVPEKGMISWQAQIKPADMQKVASYIISLKGTNPPNPKEPQGTVWKEEGAPAADTTATAAPTAGK
jgi:cytochrome c oxidase cbb3-type subunit III